MNRPLLVAVAILVVGLAALAAGVAPSLGCDAVYGLDLADRGDVDPGDDRVVAAADLPSDVRETVRDAATSDDSVNMTEPAYKTHLEDRLVAVDGEVYEPRLAAVETCGRSLEDALVVLGVLLTTIGVIAVTFVGLYGGGRPPLNRLHLVAAALLVVGAGVFATGVALPAGCTDNYALETTAIGGANETNRTVVDAGDLPTTLQGTLERSVTSNQTAFVDRAQYREHLEARAVRDDGDVYEADIVLVQDCGGGLDDALLLVGLIVATLGAVALSLLVLYDHGEKVL